MDKRVFVAGCAEYAEADNAVRRILAAFGGAEKILGGRKRVLVKPNLVMAKAPDTAITTHPDVVRAVCSSFAEAGAEVEIIDSTGFPHKKRVLKSLYAKCGMDEAAKKSGAKLSFDTKSRAAPIKDGRILKKINLLAPVLDAELVVNVAKAKTHGVTKMTGCSKNVFGCVPGIAKPMLHAKFSKREDFAGMICDVCLAVNPGFSILDGVWGMEGAGPTGGDPKHLGIIAGGFNPFALDLAQCYLMGLRPESVYSIAENSARGLAPDSPDELEWLGDAREKFRTQFRPATKGKGNHVPKILAHCTICRDCIEICPAKCMKVQGERIVIEEEKCIRCYCCHEFCPFKAIDLE